MTTKIIKIQTNIQIDAKYFGDNIRNFVIEKVTQKYNGSCTFENGYILNIKNVKLTSNWISTANTQTIFEVSFDAEILKPKAGDKLIGEVMAIYEYGIIIAAQKMITIFITPDDIKNFRYVDEGEFESSKQKINNGDKIQVEITLLKYSNKKFEYIGKII